MLNEKLTRQLNDAVESVGLPPLFEARIRRHLEASATPCSWVPKLRNWIGTVVGRAGPAIKCQFGHRHLQESYLASVSHGIPERMRVGLEVHIRCIGFYNQLASGKNPRYAKLIAIAESGMPETPSS